MTTVVLLSQNRDFTDVVCELVQGELGLSCAVAADEKEAKANLGAIVIRDDQPPFKMRELLAKIRAQLPASDALDFNGWQLSTRLKTLTRNGVQAALTDKESELLKYLIDSGGSATKDELLKHVWKFEADVDTHTLETHIYRLRGKCRELGAEQFIVASDNGYSLNP